MAYSCCIPYPRRKMRDDGHMKVKVVIELSPMKEKKAKNFLKREIREKIIDSWKAPYISRVRMLFFVYFVCFS